MDVIVKFLLVTPVLDAQIAFYVLYLFLYGNDIPSLAETYLEKSVRAVSISMLSSTCRILRDR